MFLELKWDLKFSGRRCENPLFQSWDASKTQFQSSSVTESVISTGILAEAVFMNSCVYCGLEGFWRCLMYVVYACKQGWQTFLLRRINRLPALFWDFFLFQDVSDKNVEAGLWIFRFWQPGCSMKCVLCALCWLKPEHFKSYSWGQFGDIKV